MIVDDQIYDLCAHFVLFHIFMTFWLLFSKPSHYGTLDGSGKNSCRDHHQSMFMWAILVLSVHCMKYSLP